MRKTIIKEFEEFKKIHGQKAFLRLALFLNNFREKYQKEKMLNYLKEGYDEIQAQNKSRQSWVAFLGRQLENIIILFLEDLSRELGFKILKGDQLKSEKLPYELSLVRRKIEVHFSEYSMLPDADIILYRNLNNDIEVIAILSVKNSFRERYTETPYWKIKLSQNEVTKTIKVFMITPDNDDEIAYLGKGQPSKARIVMEYELDSIYLARENFDASEKIKSLENLLLDLSGLIKK
jgi:type II restriction enzyme